MAGMSTPPCTVTSAFKTQCTVQYKRVAGKRARKRNKMTTSKADTTQRRRKKKFIMIPKYDISGLQENDLGRETKWEQVKLMLLNVEGRKNSL